MKVKKKIKVLCPHCFNYFGAHKAFSQEFYYGDEDGENHNDFYHPDYPCRIADSCPKCSEDVFIVMYVPVYVLGKPRDEFDLYTYLNNYDSISVFQKKFERLVGDDFGNEFIKEILKSKTLKEALSVPGINKKNKNFFEWLYLLSHPKE